MGKRACIFCGKQGSLTREHVIPVWLQNFVKDNDKNTKKSYFQGTHISWAGTKLSQRKASGNSHTMGVVCANCNNGWMSRLETEFSVLLPRLLSNPSSRGFSKKERRIITLWAIKTGLMANLSANYRRIIPDSFIDQISCGSSIPAGIVAFSGSCISGKPISWFQGNVAVMHVRKGDEAKIDPYNETFVFIIATENTFIGFGWHGADKKKFRLNLTSNDVHEIYPHAKNAKSPHLFDDLMIASTRVGLQRRR